MQFSENNIDPVLASYAERPRIIIFCDYIHESRASAEQFFTCFSVLNDLWLIFHYFLILVCLNVWCVIQIFRSDIQTSFETVYLSLSEIPLQQSTSWIILQFLANSRIIQDTKF